jgi:hypothetical protein
MKSLIIPVAGQSSRYPGMRPKWLLTMPDGSLMLEKSISLLDLKKFNKIIIIALKQHVKKFSNQKILTNILQKNISKKIKLILLDKPTTCQAETVMKGLQKANLKGGIIIKDADNVFDQKISNTKLNRISVINTNKIDLIDAKNKSYISFDKLGKITNIVEKKVISDYFCCGAYEFKSSMEFINYAKSCLKISKNVYISDVIYSMILDNHSFSYTEANNYIDWGTLREFKNFKNSFYTIFCDFDGCLVKNSSKFEKKPWQLIPIKSNLQCIHNLQRITKIELIITTSRPNSEKIKIIKFLKKHEIKFKEIITDLMHSKRILVNDFAETNPYPSSISVNIPRNDIGLSSILSSILKN